MHSEKTVKQKRKLFWQRIEAATRGALWKKNEKKVAGGVSGFDIYLLSGASANSNYLSLLVNMIFICFFNFSFNKKAIGNQ